MDIQAVHDYRDSKSWHSSDPLQVLVVDDDDIDRYSIKRMLNTHHYAVLEAASGEQAKKYLYGRHRIDCVLLDYFLPNTNAKHLISEFFLHELPVIVVSGHGNEEVVAASFRRNAYDYISKEGATPTVLHQSIQRTLEKHYNCLALEKKVKQLSSFSYELAHDIKGPLRSIEGFAKLLNNELNTFITSNTLDYINRIGRSAGFANRLVDEMLFYATQKIQHNPFQPVNLTVVLDEITDALDATIKSNDVTIQFPTLPTVVGIRPHLVRLFQNLILNAIQYKCSERDLVIKLNYFKSNEFYHFALSDNGQGIEAEYLDEIFKPFSSINKGIRENTTGLGLAICEQIVGQHGGTISVESDIQKGTTFKFTLSKSNSSHQPESLIN